MKFRKSLRMKFLGCLLFISILPVVILFLFTFNNNFIFYESQLSEAGDHEVKSIVTSVDSILDNLSEVLTALVFSTYDNESCMLDICSQESEGERPTDYERLLNARKFEYVTNNLIITNQYVQGVYLFNENGYTYSYVKNKELGLDENYTSSEWYQTILKSSNYEATFLYKNRIIPEGTVIKGRVFSGNRGKSVLVVVCNEDIFKQVSENNNISIVDQNGTIIYGQNEELISNQVWREISSKTRGILPSHKKNETYVYGTLKVNDWKIISKISFGDLSDLYQKNTVYLFGIIVIIIIIVLLLAIYAEREFLKPLSILTTIMSHSTINESKLPERNLRREDEIGFLYRDYDRMMKEINSLIQEKYVSEIKYLNTKFKNLMSQINAHFIFNTLENISSLAYIENNIQIATMSKALGDMLRYSIEYERDEEELWTEIIHIKQYIKIQEIRFGNHIFLKENIEDGLEKAKVVKFMLQPIIENAIEHGLAEVDNPWIIWIGAYRRESTLYVTVQDNGSGMSGETLEKVSRQIHTGDEKSSDSRYVSIGLSNIQKRIQLLYTEKYGLDIETPEEGGVKIKIRIPYHM